MLKPPCKDCKSREPGCHARCGLYEEYKGDLGEIARQRQDEASVLRYFREEANRK